MSEIMKIDTVQQYNDYFGIETCHPLVSVIEYLLKDVGRQTISY